MLVLIGVGSNVGNRIKNLNICIKHLDFLVDKKISSVYESQALLPSNAQDSWDFPFLNIAISAQTELQPLELLTKIKDIETTLGRPVKHDKWSPRIIDIDILLMDEGHNSDKLTIPHPDFLNRSFTLIPCQEIASEVNHPLLKKKLKEFLIDSTGLRLTKYKIKS